MPFPELWPVLFQNKAFIFSYVHLLWEELLLGTIISYLVLGTTFFTLWPWPYSLTYFWKNFNLGHNFHTCRDRGFNISHVHSLWQYLLHRTMIFDHVTLTLNFDLLFEKITLGMTFIPKEIGLSFFTRTFLFHMCISCDKDLSHGTIILTLWPWLWSLIYIWKTLT